MCSLFVSNKCCVVVKGVALIHEFSVHISVNVPNDNLDVLQGICPQDYDLCSQNLAAKLFYAVQTPLFCRKQRIIPSELDNALVANHNAGFAS